MTMRITRFPPIIIVILLLCRALPAFAVSTLTISSSGNGGFLLQGVGMEDIAALDITITYDTATLANPRAATGGLISGALMAVNPKAPGTLRMGIITTSPIQGAGVIATLAFDRVGNSPGRIIALKASIADSNGNPLPVQSQVVNPPDESVTAPTTPSNQGAQLGATVPPAPPTPGAGQRLVIGGGIAPLGDSVLTAKAKNEPPASPEASPEPLKEPAVVTGETVSYPRRTEQEAQQPYDRNKKRYTQKSVLERFREHQGERSAKALISLFDQEPMIGFRQDPRVALSDGKAKVTVIFIAAPSGNNAPEVKVQGAALISLKKDPDNTNTWVAEVRPYKGAYSATLVVPQDRVIMEFPLTVAPKYNVDLDKSGKVTEADFKLFLNGRGTAKRSKFDLNNDGRRDYLDDYFFTANYLFARTVISRTKSFSKSKRSHNFPESD